MENCNLNVTKTSGISNEASIQNSETIVKIDTALVDEAQSALKTPKKTAKKSTGRRRKSRKGYKSGINSFSLRTDVITKSILRQLRKYYMNGYRAYFDFTECPIEDIHQKRAVFKKAAFEYCCNVLGFQPTPTMADLII